MIPIGDMDDILHPVRHDTALGHGNKAVARNV